MKKTLNIDAISNELRGASKFFPPPEGSKPAPIAPAPHNFPSPDPNPQTPRPPGTVTSRHLDTEAPGHLDTAASIPLDTQLDLTMRAESRQTLRLTEGEFRKLGIVQGTLSEILGVTRVEKNDILRAAVHRLFEDFEDLDRAGAGSDLVTRLRKKYR